MMDQIFVMPQKPEELEGESDTAVRIAGPLPQDDVEQVLSAYEGVCLPSQ